MKVKISLKTTVKSTQKLEYIEIPDGMKKEEVNKYLFEKYGENITMWYNTLGSTRMWNYVYHPETFLMNDYEGCMLFSYYSENNIQQTITNFIKEKDISIDVIRQKSIDTLKRINRVDLISVSQNLRNGQIAKISAWVLYHNAGNISNYEELEKIGKRIRKYLYKGIPKTSDIAAYLVVDALVNGKAE